MCLREQAEEREGYEMFTFGLVLPSNMLVTMATTKTKMLHDQTKQAILYHKIAQLYFGYQQ